MDRANNVHPKICFGHSGVWAGEIILIMMDFHRVFRSACALGLSETKLLILLVTTCTCATAAVHFSSPVWLNDLLPIAHGSVPVLHVETHAHGLVHHVQHVDIGVRKYRSHLLQTELAHLQQVTGGCRRVKEQWHDRNNESGGGGYKTKGTWSGKKKE